MNKVDFEQKYKDAVSSDRKLFMMYNNKRVEILGFEHNTGQATVKTDTRKEMRVHCAALKTPSLEDTKKYVEELNKLNSDVKLKDNVPTLHDIHQTYLDDEGSAPRNKHADSRDIFYDGILNRH